MSSEAGLHVVLVHPEIHGNTGSSGRTCLAAGARLHLIEPLGFELDDARLRRAGLDYHDLAQVSVHPNLAVALRATAPGRVYAFSATAAGATRHSDVAYAPGDTLLFGPEPTGLPAAVLHDPAVDAVVHIPMLPGRRSLNLSNAAAVAAYEAWRQLDYATAPT